MYPDLPTLARLNSTAAEFQRRRVDGRPHPAAYITEGMSTQAVAAELVRLARQYADSLEGEYLSPAVRKREAVNA
jgi:hypothetical protein